MTPMSNKALDVLRLLRKLTLCPEGNSLTTWIEEHWCGEKLHSPLWHLARAEEKHVDVGIGLDDITTAELLDELKRRCDHVVIAAMLVDGTWKDGINGDMRVITLHKGNAHTCAGLALDAAESVLEYNHAVRLPSEL